MILVAAAAVMLGLTACSQEAQEQIQSAVETAAPTLEAAMQTAAPTIEAAVQTAAPKVETAVQQAATQVVAAVETAAPTLQAIGTGVAAGVQTAAPTLEAALEQVAGFVDLEANSWEWTSSTMSDQTEMVPVDPALYTLDFAVDGTVAITLDCNNASGTYTLESPDAMSIVIGPMTMAACGDESLGDAFAEQLGQVESFTIDGDTLKLMLADDAGVMEFMAAGSM
jgi:heat shock protein HslJ